jgi:5'-AMP-activated protein kinase catalytic alpha subunit
MNESETSVSRIGAYELGSLIAVGSAGPVRLARRPDRDVTFACKVLPSACLEGDAVHASLEREVGVAQRLHHPNLVELCDFVQGAEDCGLVSEYCGGSVFAVLTSGRTFTEDEARGIFRQLLAAVAYLHSQGIAHRDISPDSVLLDETSCVKLSTVRMSRILDSSAPSGCFAAPEPDNGSPEGDMWSLGVLLFAMVTGTIPWKSVGRERLVRLMTHGPVDVPAHVSQGCADLIRQLVVVDPAKRLSIDDALNHSFLTDSKPPGSRGKAQRTNNIAAEDSKLPPISSSKGIDRQGSAPRKGLPHSAAGSFRGGPSPPAVIVSQQPKIVIPAPMPLHRI